MALPPALRLPHRAGMLFPPRRPSPAQARCRETGPPRVPPAAPLPPARPAVDGARPLPPRLPRLLQHRAGAHPPLRRHPLLAAVGARQPLQQTPLPAAAGARRPRLPNPHRAAAGVLPRRPPPPLLQRQRRPRRGRVRPRHRRPLRTGQPRLPRRRRHRPPMCGGRLRRATSSIGRAAASARPRPRPLSIRNRPLRSHRFQPRALRPPRRCRRPNVLRCRRPSARPLPCRRLRQRPPPRARRAGSSTCFPQPASHRPR